VFVGWRIDSVAVRSSGIGADKEAAEGREGRPNVWLERVTKRFGDVTAVDDLTLGIKQGEFFSLLGPSGCGKTTTLRIIGGFESPTAGAVYLNGQDVTDVPPYRRDVNTVFQSYALFPHLNVFDNVAFGLRQRKVPKGDIRRRVQEALALVDLVGMEKRKPSQLSGGQQQRVALARALVNQPHVLLLDEPLGALDARLRKHMQIELKRIQIEVGITFIYVTHDQEEALTMSDRLAVMNQGHIEQVGSPQEVYEHPRTEFVASFLGASNFLEGTLTSSRNGYGIVTTKTGQEVVVPEGALPRSRGTLKVGVRPEKIRIEQDRGEVPSGWNCVTGTLRLATFVGASYQYVVDGPAGASLVVFAQNQGISDVPQPGERVRLLWLPEHTFAVTTFTTLSEEYS
jgi:spermidine/putrescine transport system ATP-binding protein